MKRRDSFKAIGLSAIMPDLLSRKDQIPYRMYSGVEDRYMRSFINGESVVREIKTKKRGDVVIIEFIIRNNETDYSFKLPSGSTCIWDWVNMEGEINKPIYSRMAEVLRYNEIQNPGEPKVGVIVLKLK